MKSNKQRREEHQAKAASKRTAEQLRLKRKAEEAKLEGIKRGAAVDDSALAPAGSYSAPDFVKRGYYVDQPFVCKDCGKAEVWTARQQKWWYEIAKGNVWTTARRCRSCRRRQRERRNEARRVHLEGLARKAQGSG